MLAACSGGGHPTWLCLLTAPCLKGLLHWHFACAAAGTRLLQLTPAAHPADLNLIQTAAVRHWDRLQIDMHLASCQQASAASISQTCVVVALQLGKTGDALNSESLQKLQQQQQRLLKVRPWQPGRLYGHCKALAHRLAWTCCTPMISTLSTRRIASISINSPRTTPSLSLLQAFQGASTESLCSDKLAEACEDSVDAMSISWHGSECIDTDTDDDMLIFANPADDAGGDEPAPAHRLQTPSQQALPGALHLLC